jgi:hypothetical protein
MHFPAKFISYCSYHHRHQHFNIRELFICHCLELSEGMALAIVEPLRLVNGMHGEMPVNKEWDVCCYVHQC